MLSEAYKATLPLQGTDVAARWDSLYTFLILLSAFFFVLVIGAMIVFAIKYREKPGIRTKYITGSHTLEAVWIVIPTILLMVIFGWGYSVYRDMVHAPTDAYEVRVIGKQWLWQFQYPNGKSTINELYVPANKPVKLIMTAQDVLHSMFIPNFRVKQDLVPGMYTSLWFEATVPGRHQIFCAEYCGTTHSGMLAQLIALDEKQWSDWERGKDVGKIPRADGRPDSVASGAGGAVGSVSGLAARGKGVFEAKGCAACHSVDGSPKVGPTLKGVYGHEVLLADGSKVTADDNYIRESIENPEAKKVKGFENMVMPPFKGLISEEDLNALIAYIQSLK